MRTIEFCAAAALCVVPSSLLAADEISVERGLYISIKPRGDKRGFRFAQATFGQSPLPRCPWHQRTRRLPELVIFVDPVLKTIWKQRNPITTDAFDIA